MDLNYILIGMVLFASGQISMLLYMEIMNRMGGE